MGGSRLLRVVPVLLLAACHADDAARRARELTAPVTTARAAAGVVPVDVEGVGSVTPITSVAVKSRVDGQIVEVRVRDGSDVRTGELLFRIDPRPYAVQLEIAQANVARDEALLAKADDLRKRSDDLIAQGFISANQYSDAAADARAAAAAVQADRAALASARLNLEFTELRSPLNGRVGRVALRAGNLVKANDSTALLTINQLEPIYVDFAAPERHLSDLRRAAQQGEVRVALTAEGESGAPIEREGRLIFLDNEVDAPTGTVRLRAELPNRDHALWPGQYARVRVHLAVGGAVTWVPASAIGQGPDGPYVYVVDAGSHALQRPVRVERADAERAVIASGLAAGERVIVDGQSRVLPGGLVSEAQPSGPSPAAQSAAH
jgi:multidrug efflux system membrane fusion protein